jgi:CheY-like chemotaxis protein
MRSSLTLDRGGGESVLVVDDEPHLRRVVRELLTSSGYRVAEASEGEGALRLYQEAMDRGKRFDLVILDLAMPVMDGETCLRNLMEMDPEARVLFATGYNREPLDSMLRQQGALGILFKPFDLSTMLRTIRAILQ